MSDEEVRFEALCSALRRNDPDTITVIHVLWSISCTPQHCGRRLGEALQGNRRNLLHHREEGPESHALLLRYIRESKEMREVSLTVQIGSLYARHLSVLRLFLLSIAENPCIEALTLLVTGVPWEAFAHLLRTTQSLKTLKVTAWTEERKPVAESLGANRTLESLTFDLYSNTTAVESALLQLGSLSRLRELKLQCGNGASLAHIHALAHLLRSTTSLTHLLLARYHFDKERMECIVKGLNSNQSITKLSLECCSLHMEAMNVFCSFMQTGETRSCIRELRIRDCERFSIHFCTGAMLASLLIMSEENQDTGSSVGSSLLVLDLDYVHAKCVKEFIDALAANASRIRLSCLRLGNCRDYQLKALCSCLPKLVCLKVLDILAISGPDVGPDVGPDFGPDFVDALRQNGSLQRVTIVPARHELRDFNARERLLMKHYCWRNEAIPIMAAKIRLDNNDTTDPGLLPMLFQSTKQAPRTAPNTILIGLLAAGDSIGTRHCDRKRVRSDE